MAQKRLLTIEEASEYLGISKKTLYKWVHERKIPYVKIGRKCLRFDIEKLNKWIEEKTFVTLKVEKVFKIPL